MNEISKAFAVEPGTPSPRKTAYTPKSAGWTLYRLGDLAEKLNVDVVSADVALEATGFNKAVRIREELIRWKERLRKEEAELDAERERLRKEHNAISSRLALVREQLANVRNILRLPRENPSKAAS